MSTAAAPAAVALLARLDTDHPLLAVRPVRELSAAARGLPAPPEVKFLVVAAVNVPASFVVGHFVAPIPGVKGWCERDKAPQHHREDQRWSP